MRTIAVAISISALFAVSAYAQPADGRTGVQLLPKSQGLRNISGLRLATHVDREGKATPRSEPGASPAAPAPGPSPLSVRMPRQGDTWTYRLVQPDGTGNLKRRRYDVVVGGVTATSILEQVQLEEGSPGHSSHDRARYLTFDGVAVFSPYLGVFEDLAPGSRLGPIAIKQPYCKDRLICEAAGHVAGHETVTVKAGTFDTVKVVVDQNWRPLLYRGGGQAPMGWTDGRRFTVWYSPAVKRAVKFTSRVTRGNDRPDGGHYDLELESYRLQ